MPELVSVDIGDVVAAPADDACEATLLYAIERTRQELLTGRREQRNRLANNISAGAGSMDFDFALGGIGPNARLGIGLEIFHVWDATGTTATVEPAQEGSVAAAHDEGDIVWVNSRATDWDILNAINDVLKDLSSPACGLFGVAHVDLAYDANVYGYDLDGVENLEDVLDIWYETPTTTRWVPLKRRHWRIERNADTAVFPSGLALTVLSGLAANDAATIRVTYKTRFSPLADYSDNIETTTLLHCDAHDLLWIGAALRLAESREIVRNDTSRQGEPRRSSEVPSGGNNGAVARLERRWNNRLKAEGGRLSRRFPTYYR